MNSGHSANKKSLLEELLNLGMVLVALDARYEGVDVPIHLAEDPQLRLNLSYRFGLPMAIDPWGISATLTFGGIPHECRFPWRAVFLMVSHNNGEPYVFPADVPQELVQPGHGDGRWSLREAVLPNPARAPRLSVVPSGSFGEAPKDAPQKPRKRSRRATGSGFSPAARRAAREPASDEPPPPPSHPPESHPLPPGGEGPKPGRSRHHLRVVK